jgi:hypothetical protein
MKFSVLALDYDGTIAGASGVDPALRDAIAAVRAKGVVVLLVTGRILHDLFVAAGDLHFVDAVVAENGAVIFFPGSGYERVLAPAHAPELVKALRADNVPIEVGRAVIETDAGDAPRVLAAIRRLELPLVLAFNRGRLMVLPQSVSKATGLKQALTVLRLSPHNAIAIGDAENDHELLKVCEVGVAVGWGSPALQAIADRVVPGTGPADLAPYLHELASLRRVPAPMKTRRRLRLGYLDDGRPFDLAVRGRNLLVAGDPKSGKSWVGGLVCEQLILEGYCLCVLDPEGDFTSLEALPRVTVYGGADPLPRPRDLLRALRHPDGSVVVDLSHVAHQEMVDYIRNLLPGLAALRWRTGLPHRIVLDEAHYVLADQAVGPLIDLELNGYILMTYRASQLQPAILASTEAIVVTRESDPHEVHALAALCATCQASGRAPDWAHLLGSLAVGEAVVLPMTEETRGEVRRLHLASRLTPHARHAAKYVDIPVPMARAFVFERTNGAPRVARTLREFVAEIETSPRESLAAHLRRGDFSRWVADVLGDYPLAVTLRRMEHEHRTRGTEGVAHRLSEAIRSRYEFVEIGEAAEAAPAH